MAKDQLPSTWGVRNFFWNSPNVIDNSANRLHAPSTVVNPLKGSGIGWLHFKVFSAIQV